MTLSLAGIGRAAIDLLYPPRCSLCGRGSDFLCATCREALPQAIGARCDVCWMPQRGDACRDCLERPVAFEHLRSAYRYEGEVRRLVHAFKFGGQSCLVPALGESLIELWQREALSADVIVPVALVRRRENQRGNVEGVFSVRRPEAIAGRRVMLVDDIATTGATLDACAGVLLQSGAGAVSALTLARED